MLTLHYPYHNFDTFLINSSVIIESRSFIPTQLLLILYSVDKILNPYQYGYVITLYWQANFDLKYWNIVTDLSTTAITCLYGSNTSEYGSITTVFEVVVRYSYHFTVFEQDREQLLYVILNFMNFIFLEVL